MKSYRIQSAVGVAFLGVFLTACGTNKVEPVASLDYSASTAVETRLSSAVERAVQAQEELARVQIARTRPAPLPLDETALPEELKRPATIEWSGPASQAAERIARFIGYDFMVTGNRPSIEPSIDVSLKDVPAAKALEQIGLQAHPFGEVVVDPNVKRVEFRFLQAHQQPMEATGTSPNWGK